MDVFYVYMYLYCLKFYKVSFVYFCGDLWGKSWEVKRGTGNAGTILYSIGLGIQVTDYIFTYTFVNDYRTEMDALPVTEAVVTEETLHYEYDATVPQSAKNTETDKFVEGVAQLVVELDPTNRIRQLENAANDIVNGTNNAKLKDCMRKYVRLLKSLNMVERINALQAEIVVIKRENVDQNRQLADLNRRQLADLVREKQDREDRVLIGEIVYSISHYYIHQNAEIKDLAHYYQRAHDQHRARVLFDAIRTELGTTHDRRGFTAFHRSASLMKRGGYRTWTK